MLSYAARAVTSQAAPGMRDAAGGRVGGDVVPGPAWLARRPGSALRPSSSPVALGEERSYSTTSATSRPISIGSSTLAPRLDRIRPRPAARPSRRGRPARRRRPVPDSWLQAEGHRGLGEPGGEERVLGARAPAQEGQPAAGPQRLPQVGERRRRVLEEHDAEVAQHDVERARRELVHLGVGRLEAGVGHPGLGGEPPRLFDLDPGQVGAQGVPVAGGPGRQDRDVTAAAPDVEDAVPRPRCARRRGAGRSSGPAFARAVPAAR